MGVQSARIGLVTRVGAFVIFSLLLSNCAGGDRVKSTNYSPKIVTDGDPIPRGGGSYRVGRPYMINGKTYHPEEKALASKLRLDALPPIRVISDGSVF